MNKNLKDLRLVLQDASGIELFSKRFPTPIGQDAFMSLSMELSVMLVEALGVVNIAIKRKIPYKEAYEFMTEMRKNIKLSPEAKVVLDDFVKKPSKEA